MVEKLRMAQDLYATEIKELELSIQQKGGNCSHIQLPTRNKILETLSQDNTKVFGMSPNGCVTIERETRIEREVPVVDKTTKVMTEQMIRYLRKLFVKYPKLQDDMDVSVREIMGSQMGDLISQ